MQFLNTLRFPIQLYVQTRSLNLKDIIDGYKDKVKNLKKKAIFYCLNFITLENPNHQTIH